MPKTNLTTVQLHKTHHQKLKALANQFDRSGRSLLEILIDDEYQRVFASQCPHPEDQREPVQATVSSDGGALNQQIRQRQVIGFRCQRCGGYVFSADQIEKQEL